MKRFAKWLGAALLLAAAAAFILGPGLVQSHLNKVLPRPAYAASAAAQALHKRLVIADMHCDALLWGNDLREHGTRGHVDVPRLALGNVALEGFTVVTKTPRGLNYDRNDPASLDNVTLLALIQAWPPRTWTSLTERALYQAGRLRELADGSDGRFTLIRTADDLGRYLERRAKEPGVTAGFLGIEGAHAIGGELANVERLFDAGYRMMAPTHFFDNEIGGSAHGVDKGGLTELGRAMLRRMEAKGMLLDLAHASPRTFDDAIAAATRPVVVSHTGVRATCDNVRNLSDDQLRAIARTDGVVGIGFWETATCGTDGKAIAKAIRHAVSIAGVDHVGLGSDFDGAIEAPFDATGLVEITDGLLGDGFGEDEIAKIMGANVFRILGQVLP
jgi:microsomal dipeptidase-like Zn-dependent dipeptidase